MYNVFNMGHRIELYIDEKFSEEIIKISNSFGVEAKIIGEIIESDKNKLTIKSPEGLIEYK
jgi:phosphoribosylformylglycinamidine cyclo-ligase